MKKNNLILIKHKEENFRNNLMYSLEIEFSLKAKEEENKRDSLIVFNPRQINKALF